LTRPATSRRRTDPVAAPSCAVWSALRIAMIAACPFPLGRGTPIRIQRQAETLAARGHEVHVVT
jgi:hypothetical protein